MSLLDLFSKNAHEMTALEHAINSGNRQVVDILLQQGAARNQRRPTAAGQAHHPAPTAVKPGQEKKPIKVMKPLTLKHIHKQRRPF